MQLGGEHGGGVILVDDGFDALDLLAMRTTGTPPPRQQTTSTPSSTASG